jgi:type II restriction/modification system DNA methylase subunit YeeA
VELAKVTLMLAKKLGLDEAYIALERDQIDLPFDEALPLDNLDPNFICNDALFVEWPEVDAIVGNPPYQSKNKMQAEFGRAYVNRLRSAYPKIPGRADYCVYWFRKAHDQLKPGQRAGLVGTNTIRQNYSRQGGLDYIVGNGGMITEAVSTIGWSGEAVVYVSIVNWIKGSKTGKKRLYIQEGNNPSQGWSFKDIDEISSSLSFDLDITTAHTIQTNAAKGGCFQGQTHGHEGFLLDIEEANIASSSNTRNKEVLFPYIIANDLIGRKDSLPTRYVIDFHPRDQLGAQSYKNLFEHIKRTVLPDRQKAADEEKRRNDAALKANPKAAINHHHKNFLNKWWLLSYPREEMILEI